MGNQVSSQGNEDNTFGIGGGKDKENKGHVSNGERKQRGTHIVILNKDKGSSGSEFFKDNISSYKGVITDPSNVSGVSLDKEKESTKDQTEQSVNEGLEKVERVEIKDLKVSTPFEWREGGSSVYLTGSFCNWNQKFLMNQSNNKFELSLVILNLTHLGPT